MKKFMLMLGFLTTIPVNIKACEDDFGKDLYYAIPVGLLTGGILSGSWYLMSFILPVGVIAVLLNIIYIKITGGLHMDGFGDTFDGAFSNRPREKMLEIMKDSRLGSNAAIAIVLIFLLNTSLFIALEENIIAILILLPVTGRMAMLSSAGIFKYARKQGGMGRSFIEHCNIKQVIYGLVMCILIFSVFLNIYLAGAGILSLIVSMLFAKNINRKLGGITGDVLGAVCEISQTLFLLFACILI